MAGEKILLVDDEKAITELLKLHLEEEGYETISAQSVDKALKVLDREPIALVMLDIQMPGKSGLDFLEAVQTEYGKTRIPVIVMTCRGELQSLADGSTADGFVSKPFEMPLVMAEIRRIFSEKEKAVYLADIEGSALPQAIAEALRKERFQVFFIKDMQAFKECWEKQPAEYVVMEYQQHSIAGGDMIREIRACSPSVPIIVYSHSGVDFRERSMASGASVYLGQPKVPAEVMTAIRKFEIK